MKVILLKDVRGVGMHGTVKDVADGYAINKLFPSKLAEPATPEKIKQIQEQSAARDEQRKKDEEQLDAKVVLLRGKTISIESRATEKGGLFKSITSADIAKAIRAQHSLEIPEDVIHINEAIKTVGEHIVSLQSKSNKADVGIVVTPSL